MIPVRELTAATAAALCACAVEVCLRTLPLPRTARIFGVSLRTTGGSTVAPRQAVLGRRGRLQARAVQRVMRHWPFDDTCLRHALVAGHRLRRFGPELVIGVTKVDGAVRAHAWLEFDSGIYDPLGAAPAYHPLTSSPPEG
ncbi:lasso peptide biosynthesis B2 protein [Ruania suaedae]|uniref:lasso peptide biosynthesis B2 protein n=1 Tax=Ruania suaedae TaxID=2897774 RepID=UPI001E3D1D22|nr:lasso peptide biosynthesis B2 protein [Ruania suaedae]UFU02400.1 lasso peptide biosynthesis B2 protein [Ruania suaedae]